MLAVFCLQTVAFAGSTGDPNIDNGGGIYPRISGTPSESAVDAVIIDPPTGRISTVRYGAGIDREFVIRN